MGNDNQKTMSDPKSLKDISSLSQDATAPSDDGQRNNAKKWIDYFTSGCFLDAAWDSPFAVLLLEHVTRLEAQYLVNREFLKWLCAACQFTVAQTVYLNPDGSRGASTLSTSAVNRNSTGRNLSFKSPSKARHPGSSRAMSLP